jgi:coproporphyrinogen III oxidase
LTFQKVSSGICSSPYLEDQFWNAWCDNYFQEHKEIEDKDLGGVHVRQHTEVDLENSFDFSIEEIRQRFNDFLNPSNPTSVDAAGSDGGFEEDQSLNHDKNVDEWL